MIPRKLAKRLIDEYLDRLCQAESDAGEALVDEDLFALRDDLLTGSDLVLRGTENVRQKGTRYLTEGRLRVEKIESSGLIVASCRGTGATYQLGYDPIRHEWRCQCSLEKGGSRKRECSHLVALKLVIDEPKEAT